VYPLLNEVFFSVLACIGHLAEAGSPSLRGNEKYYTRNFINGKYNTIFCDNKKRDWTVCQSNVHTFISDEKFDTVLWKPPFFS